MNPATLMNIYRFGIYYSPAISHYGGTVAAVRCDRCARSNLSTCVGWENHDLCEHCVTDLDDILGPKSLETDIDQPKTRMEQQQFNTAPYEDSICSVVQKEPDDRSQKLLDSRRPFRWLKLLDSDDLEPQIVTKMMQSQYR
jgi:hypothetical protein